MLDEIHVENSAHLTDVKAITSVHCGASLVGFYSSKKLTATAKK